MAAIALEMPGVRIAAMPRKGPTLAHRWRDARMQIGWHIGGRLLAYEIARAVAVGDPVARAARYERLRERYRRAEGGIAAMATAIRDLDVERPLARGPALSRITGPGWDDDGVLLYVPGGSFVIGRSPHFTAMIARIARAVGIAAEVCDYRLAPEHPCPAAIDDVEDAADVLIARGFAPERIVMVAESTGGGIALAAAQRLVARGRTPGGLALLSPWIDCDPARPDLHPVARQCARLYLNGAAARDPARNPAYGTMRGLPPVVIHGNRGDPMFADAQLLAQRAGAAGVSVDLRHWPGSIHVLERFDDPDAQRSIAEIAAFIRARLSFRRAA